MINPFVNRWPPLRHEIFIHQTYYWVICGLTIIGLGSFTGRASAAESSQPSSLELKDFSIELLAPFDPNDGVVMGLIPPQGKTTEVRQETNKADTKANKENADENADNAEAPMPGARANEIYSQMHKRRFLTYSWLGFFTTYHAMAAAERTTFLTTQKPLFGEGLFVSHGGSDADQRYARYVSRFDLTKDILSLLSLASRPYKSTLYLSKYYETTSDDPQKTDQMMEHLLHKAAAEQESPRSLKSHLVRLGVHSVFSLFIAFDYGDSHRAIEYFVSSFIGGEIKSYLTPYYAPGILKNSGFKTSVFFDSPQLFFDLTEQSPARSYRLTVMYHL